MTSHFDPDPDSDPDSEGERSTTLRTRLVPGAHQEKHWTPGGGSRGIEDMSTLPGRPVPPGRRRGLLLAAVGLAVGLGTILWIGLGRHPDGPASSNAFKLGGSRRSHPVWGAATEIQATDGASVLGMDSGPGILSWVNRQVVRLGWVKAGRPMPWAKPTPAILNLGEYSLEWSMRNSADGSGWLYFWDPVAWGPNGTRSMMVWSFAPVDAVPLDSLEASHLDRPFFSQTSPEWPSIFGVRKKGQSAIEVSKGQVLLARHQLDSNAVYVLEFTGASNATVHVTYLRIPTTAPVGRAAP